MSIIFKAKRRVTRWARGLLHHSTLPILVVLAKRKYLSTTANVRPEPPTSEIVIPDRNYLPLPEVAGNVPRIIFQTWKSKVDIPYNYRVWRKTFFTHNPDYKILLWDDFDNRSFIEKEFPWFLEYYDRYPREIFRADAVRILFLFYYGGFYADMDTECLRPLDFLLDRGQVLLGRMGPDQSFEHSIPNAIMATAPRQLFWLFVAHMMIKRLNEYPDSDKVLALGPETFTGPIILKNATDRFNSLTEAEVWSECAHIVEKLTPEVRATIRYSKLTILDAEEWYPVDWTNPIHRMLRANINNTQVMLSEQDVSMIYKSSSMVTYWSNSWAQSVTGKASKSWI